MTTDEIKYLNKYYRTERIKNSIRIITSILICSLIFFNYIGHEKLGSGNQILLSIFYTIFVVFSILVSDYIEPITQKQKKLNFKGIEYLTFTENKSTINSSEYLCIYLYGNLMTITESLEVKSFEKQYLEGKISEKLKEIKQSQNKKSKLKELTI